MQLVHKYQFQSKESRVDQVLQFEPINRSSLQSPLMIPRQALPHSLSWIQVQNLSKWQTKGNNLRHRSFPEHPAPEG